MRVAVLGGGSISLSTARALAGLGHNVMIVDVAARPLMDPWEFLREPDVNPYFSLDDFLWDAMCPREFLRELNSAPLYNSIENRCVQPFYKEHYDDERSYVKAQTTIRLVLEMR